MSAISDSEKSAARWMPFQCPTCFALFRLQKGNTGSRGHCPQCNEILTVPGNKKKSEPVAEAKEPAVPSVAKTIAVARAEAPETGKSWEDGQEKRKRRYIGESEEGLHWEGERRKDEKSFSWMIACSCVLMLAVLCAVGIYLVKNSPSKKGTSGPVVIGDAASAAVLEESRRLPVNESYLDEQGVDVIEESMKEYEKFDFLEIEKTVKRFLESNSIEKRIALVRDPERVRPLMEKYYGSAEFEPEGFEELNKHDIRFRDNFFTSYTRMGDFSVQSIAVERVEKGDEVNYLVDWESWVGYCEVSVEDLIRSKPTDSKLVRIMLTKGAYYNYGFSDDRKWSSYRISFRNSDRRLLAYMERESKDGKRLEELMRKIDPQFPTPFMMKIRYPDNARSGEQVEIVELVSQGWIEGLQELEEEELEENDE